MAFEVGSAPAADESPLSELANGWSIDLIAKASEVKYPTVIVFALDRTIYSDPDRMTMPGPPNEPLDSGAIIRRDRVSTFADKLWAVMGLEGPKGRFTSSMPSVEPGRI